MLKQCLENVGEGLLHACISSFNIISLVKHVDELRVYMRDEPFDILSINESRLDANIARDTVGIQGYDMVAKHRNREGGGVTLY